MIEIKTILNEVRADYGSNGLSDEYEEQLAARIEGLVRAKEAEAENYGRLNEHHVISNMFSNEDFRNIKSGALTRIKWRQKELMEKR